MATVYIYDCTLFPATLYPVSTVHCIRLDSSFQLLEIHQKVNAVIHENKTFSDFCLKWVMELPIWIDNDNYLNSYIIRIPITNFLVAGIDKKKRRRKRRQTSGEGKSPAGTTRNVEVVEDPVSQDYYPEEYFDFYRDGTDSMGDFEAMVLNLPYWCPHG